MNSSTEPRDWQKIYRQLYAQKPRQQPTSSPPIYPMAPVFAFAPTPNRIVFPDPNGVVPPGFHPYPTGIFRPVPPPGLFRKSIELLRLLDLISNSRRSLDHSHPVSSRFPSSLARLIPFRADEDRIVISLSPRIVSKTKANLTAVLSPSLSSNAFSF